MKKLHKKLRKVAENIDLTNANQTGKLKNLAIACQDYELAAEMRGFERLAEQELAESSKFTKDPSEFTPLEKKIYDAGCQTLESVSEDLITSEEESGLYEEETTKILEEEEPILLVNSIRTPDGTILTSRGRHDFVCHDDTVTGTKYCIDGGLEYRRYLPGGVYVDLSVYSDDPFEKIREGLERGGRGKNFDKDFQWYKLKDMNDNWLAELILWLEENQPNNKYKKYYLQEIEYRKENGITIKEEE